MALGLAESWLRWRLPPPCASRKPKSRGPGTSAAAWELILEKCIAWQKHVGLFCGIPGCEPFCLLTGGCCCACAVCLFCSYTGRTTFETETEAEINEMLKKYAIRAKFESEGMLFFMNVHLNFYWV